MVSWPARTGKGRTGAIRDYSPVTASPPSPQERKRLGMALGRAKLKLMFSKTPFGRKSALEEIERLNAKLGKASTT